FPWSSSALCQPSCSPLLPYTTLFRSLIFLYDFFLHGSQIFSTIPAFLQMFLYQFITLPAGQSIYVTWKQIPDNLTLHLHTSSPLDRKSTRLNSSHVSTSYAVFCLKTY